MLRKTIYVGISTTILLVGMLSGCSGRKANKDNDNNKKQLISVSTTLVQEGLVSNDVTFTGVIKPITTNNIISQVGGRLDKLMVDIGDNVHKSQVLAIMDQSQLNQIKVKLNDAKINYTRADELYKVGGISKSQWEQAASQKDILLQQYNNLKNNTILLSPCNGVVTARNYDVGDMTSMQMPILVIEDISKVKLILGISEKYYSMLKRNMPVIISADAITGKSFKGYISKIYPTIDNRTHSVTIEVTIDNSKKELRPGMFVKAFIKFSDVKSMLVPDAAVMSQLGSGEKIVYILDNGKAVAKTVQVGRIVGDKYQILSGINVSDTIITSNINALFSGMAVNPITDNK